MQKIENSKLPTISGAASRKPVLVNNLDDLKVSGVPFTTYSIRKGDVVEFPNTLEDAQVFSQPVRANSTASQMLVVILRNGKVDYLSMGTLRKQDINNEYTCKFTSEMGAYNNDYDRLAALCGKKITATDVKTIKVQDFDRLTGERLEGKTRDQVVPIIEYV